MPPRVTPRPTHSRPGCVARMSETARPVVRHAWWEDIQAVPLGCALIALGISFFAQAGLLSGGTVGLAFLFNYWGGWSLGGMFFLINLPFYALALWRMGWKFTLRTFCAVALVSLFVELTPGWRSEERRVGTECWSRG